MAVIDALDTVSADCETVLGPPGTRQNPIPLGQSANLGNGWVVTVTGVFPNATAQVIAANMFNQPPAAGNQFFMIAVLATYTGSGSSRLDSGFAFRAVGASNVVYTTFNNSCGVLPEPDLELNDPEVFAGGTISGNAACWEIRASDAASLMLFSDPFLLNRRVFFALS